MFNQKKIIIPELDIIELDEYISLKEAQTVIFNDERDEDLVPRTIKLLRKIKRISR